MKTPYLSLLAAALFTGCMTIEEKQWTCDTAKAAYAGYQATIAAGHKPSKEEIQAVTGAATFLRIWCGWDYVQPVRMVVLDSNKVPLIHEPK